jgi:hypothetical protein
MVEEWFWRGDTVYGVDSPLFMVIAAAMGGTGLIAAVVAFVVYVWKRD